MTDVVTTIAPIFLIIGFGAFLKARAGFGDAFWHAVSKLTFNGLFPALLFLKIAGADVDWSTALPSALCIVIGVFAAAIAAVPFRRVSGIDAPKFVAMFQGGFRSNAYVGIAVVLGVLGDDAAGPLSISILALALTINTLGVWAHAHWLGGAGQEDRKGLRGVLVDCVRNPLIVACLAGAAFNVLGLGLPPVIGPTLELLSRAALPMALMAVGAGLSLTGLKGDWVPITVSCFCKLVVHPAAGLAVGMWFGLEGAALIAPVVFCGLPTSSTAYVVSRRMGSDAALMASIVTASHIAAIVTIPMLVGLLK